MRVVNLSSGSESNMTYVESEESKILIDLGLSCKEAEIRLKKIGVDPSCISAILVTHEHSDHIKGIDNMIYQFLLTMRFGMVLVTS